MNPVIGFASLVAIAVGAGASGALNMWWDADIDAVMARTISRPIPAGRVQPGEALAFGLTLAIGSVIVLGLVANLLAAGLLAFTIFFYVVVYSMGLKRRTAQNIVIGGAAGAFPPMIGYAAATNALSLESAALFAIIFLWTPPHFWALALVKAGDYARAGVPMLPVVAGSDVTRRQILFYTLLLAPVGLLPVAMGFGGVFYAFAATGLWSGDDRPQRSGLSPSRRRRGEQGGDAAVRVLDRLPVRAFCRSPHRAPRRRWPVFSWAWAMSERPESASGGRAGIVLTPEEQRRRRSRSLAIGLGLAALSALFYIVTIAKMGGAVPPKPL